MYMYKYKWFFTVDNYNEFWKCKWKSLLWFSQLFAGIMMRSHQKILQMLPCSHCSEARHTAVIPVIRWSYPNPYWWHCAPMTWERGRGGFWNVKISKTTLGVSVFSQEHFSCSFLRPAGLVVLVLYKPSFVVMWSVGGSCGRRTKCEIWMLILLWWCLLPTFCDVGCLSYWQSADFCTSSVPKTNMLCRKKIEQFQDSWRILLLM